MPNPNPGSEHVGNDGEGLYIDLGLQYPKPVNPEASPLDTSYDLDGFDESSSDEEDGVEDIDEIVKDREHAQKPELNYDKNGPPMAVETLYSDMSAFKLVLASHATKYEFQNMSFIITLKRVIRLATRCTAVARMWVAGGDFMPLLFRMGALLR